MKKGLLFKIVTIVFIIIITAACTPKKTENSSMTGELDEWGPGYDDYEVLPPGFGYHYGSILDGHLYDFAGIWSNGHGERAFLAPNGVFAYENMDGYLNWQGIAAYNFTRGVDNNTSYSEIGTDYMWFNAGETYGYAVVFYPAGVYVKIDNQIIETDITKDRIYTFMNDYYPSSNTVYYLDTHLIPDFYSYPSIQRVQVNVVATTNTIFSELASKYSEYIDDKSGQWLFFTSNTYIEDFWFIDIGYFEDSGALYVPRILYKCQLSPDLPFLVITIVSSGIPQRGISYIDEYNTRKYFFIAEDGIDGSIYLVQFFPESFG